MALPTSSVVVVRFLVLLCTIPLIFTDARELKWCHAESATEQCKALATKFTDIKCVSAPSIFHCLELVKARTADVLYVSDTELYAAGHIGLEPLMQVVHEDSANYRYKAVAVVKAGGKVKNLADLKNAKSCHTGAGKTTGWTTPVANLIQKGVLPLSKNCYSSAENVADFFMQSCVPGAMTKRYNPLERNPPRLCGLCEDKQTPCSPKDKYAGYDGAKLCLEETAADVAFVKHDTMLNANKNLYKLLCPEDKLMELDQYEACNWAVRPSDTIVISPLVTKEVRIEIAKDLVANLANLKETVLKGNDVLKLEYTDLDYSAIMGKGFKNTFEYYHNCKSSLRWCTISEAEFAKCEVLKLAFMAKRATNKLSCVKATDHNDCIAKVEQKKADFVVLDGGDLEIAMNSCKLQPVIAETYGVENAAYYTVAVVKATANFNIKQLKGKKSCHTGIGKTSGWKSPIAYLIQNKMLEEGHDIAEEVGEFFNASCVPGALLPKYNPHGHNPKNLCALCPKDSGCFRNATNKYYDYSGAFRCLVETDADVAFIKHTTVSESTDGNGDAEWEKDLKSSDYKLLCKDGTLAAVSEWQKCHLAKVPAHAMVIRKDDTELNHLLFQIFNNFDLSSEESKKLLFTSPGSKNALFKDSTKDLVRITKPEDFLGEDYLEILKVFGEKINVCGSGASQSTISVILVLFTVVNYFA